MNENKNLLEVFIYEFIYLILFSDEEIIDKEITLNDLIIAIIVLSSSVLILYNINDIF
jgi:DNA polymerase sigma